MRPTRLPLLLLVFAAAAAVLYLIADHEYESLPAAHIYAVVWLAALGVVELYVARTTRARLNGQPGTKPIHPLSVARLAALAKASSAGGALVGGGYAGFLAYVAQQSSSAASADTKAAAVALGFSLLLVVAALLLERVCRVPE